MSSFNKRWSQGRREPLTDRVREAIAPSGPLKNRIQSVQQALKREISKLDNVEGKLKKKDSKMMHNVITAMEKHDGQYASTRANELAETRKMMRMTNQTKMVLEQISLRLGTVEELGDVVTVLSPVIPVIRGIKGGLSGFLPDAGSEIDEIGDTLNNLLMDAGHITGSTMSFEPGSEDAEKIMSEASAVAEQKRIEKFPQVPSHAADNIQTEQDNTL
ncbi:MAG: Snf7 family protein [Nitrososphaerales archaeon]